MTNRQTPFLTRAAWILTRGQRAAMMLLLCVLIGVTGAKAQTPPAFTGGSGGDGTEENPYQIATASELTALANYVNRGYYGINCSDLHFVLTADIDFNSNTSNNFPGIGHRFVATASPGYDTDYPFNGHFNGNNHTISGIRYTSQASDLRVCNGLFGLTGDDAVIENVIVDNAQISGPENVGGIVGCNRGTVRNCHVKNSSFSTVSYTINRSYGNNFTAREENVGGVVGRNDGWDYYSTQHDYDCTVTGCTADNVTISAGADRMGGIVGCNWNSYAYVSSTISNCFAKGITLYGGYAIADKGAIVGLNQGSHATLSYNYYNSCTIGSESTNIGASAGNSTRTDITTDDGAVESYMITVGQDITVTSPIQITVPTTPATVFNVAKAGAVIPLTYTGTVNTGYQADFTVLNGSTPVSVTLTDATHSEFTMPEGNVTISVTVNPIPWSGSGNSANDPYIIGYNSQWDMLAANVNSGTTYSGKFFRLDTDINVTTATMVGIPEGDNQHFFKGTFNGNNHTITFNVTNATEQYIAPFRGIESATITGVKLVGTVSSGNRFAGGIVAYAKGTSTVSNCLNSTSISLANYNLGTSPSNGGIVGMVGGHGTINILGCVFNGNMAGNKVDAWCGILGLCNDQCTANITDCLFDPTNIANYGQLNARTWYLYRKSDSGTANPVNSYYIEVSQYFMKTGQGKSARSITAGTNVTLANAGTVTEYNVSGVTSYGTGIKYNNVLYAGDGDNVSLTLGNTGSAPAYGYAVRYDPSAGTITGTANPFTLTMPDENVTVNANIVEYMWSGSGTESDPYLIQNTYDLDMLAYRVNNWPISGSYYVYTGTYFKMTADIDYSSVALDASGSNYTPIGVGHSQYGETDKRLFQGVFDGDGHVISGITINSEHSSKGLFANNCGVVRNVAVSNSSIAGHSFVGAIVGRNDCVVENCHATSNVTVFSTTTHENLNTNYGGIVGYNYSGNPDLSEANRGIVRLCTSAVAVRDYKNGNGHGGIVGFNDGRVSQCIYSGSTVEGNSNVGPIVGSNVATVTDCYWTNSTFTGCSAADNKDNTGYITTLAAIYSAMNQTGYSNAFKALAPTSITLNGRTLYKDGGWNTLCLPFSLSSLTGTPLAGATLMELDLVDDGTYTHATGLDNGTLYLNFKNASSIVAGTPYIIKWESGSNIENPTFTGITVSNETHNVSFTGGQFLGTYGYQQFTAEDTSILFMGTNNTLFYPQPSDLGTDNPKYPTIGAFRAYFHLEANQARSFVLNFDDETTTGIITMEDGKLKMEDATGWYTIDGRKLNGKPTKSGMYINNGLKVVIK